MRNKTPFISRSRECTACLVALIGAVIDHWGGGSSSLLTAFGYQANVEEGHGGGQNSARGDGDVLRTAAERGFRQWQQNQRQYWILSIGGISQRRLPMTDDNLLL